ncbi:terminase large subunit [Tumebacillus permanentifrigoris]|uniref:Phage terminase large subunit-like protein n=1 Tax=Tumebacillus permanentifrigoris TaxID=378543 RepID=A0A316D395_9BACL|nr:terminase TerL endonuclease subunit [Tumebacillus permanentifrigoris]PWK05310.1 phage terminase large subunit-like protein [Tumebacillus permanentifrigoris]
MIDAVTRYANAVLSGEIVAGLYVKLACERHLNDLLRQGTEGFPYVFSEKKAKRIFKFAKYCRHVKGELAGQPIKLDPFQKFILGSIFGWVHTDTKLRRYNKAYVQVARKQAKSTKLSVVGLYMLTVDGEGGPEVYATATKKDQAKIVFDDSKAMVNKSPDLKQRLKVTREAIKKRDDEIAKFVPLSKDTKTADGYNPHLGILDEYHAHPTSEMYDVLESGMGQRAQPLLFIITTAGFDLSAPCYSEYEYCCKILKGDMENDNYFIYIAQLDEEDDINDESVWIKANPLSAQTERGMKYLRQQLLESKDKPEKQRSVLTKNFNKWINMRPAGYMNMDKWKLCAAKLGEFPDLRGRICYVGIDLSKRIDLSSVAFIFPLEDGIFAVKSHSFIPSETLTQKQMTDKQDYSKWVRDGWITATEGAVIDYEYIKRYIIDTAVENEWVIQEICYDPYNATQFAQGMMIEGYEMVEIRQGMKTLSEPTKSFRDLVYDLKVIHEDNPVLNWAMTNAVQKDDANENIMLDKKKSTERIDPAAALVNAHVRAMLRVESNNEIQVWSFD